MDTERWNTIESILDQALALPKAERCTYINSACNGDTTLTSEVLNMLDAIEISDNTHFLEDISTENHAFFEDITKEKRHNAAQFIGKKIGAFEIKEEVATGGMGSIFRATRVDGAFNQQVAIKLVKQGLNNENTLKRFQLERQILARLAHPNIARIYDGGVTNDGNPYLVMEYIDGMPIDKYCNHHFLPIKERLRLFKDVCKAVEFAHRNLVIHRDLKAQNIYVNESGMVKILDFGIAKLLNPELQFEDLVVTQPGQGYWTPHYAAPEQTENENITTATDVYSLGILLHKLIVGRFPFDFSGKSLTQIKSIINKETPDTLSQSLQKESSPEKIAAHRNISVNDLKRVTKSDLSAIVYKAIRRLPEYRYKSVGQLVDDIKNYEKNLPISARRNSVFYRIDRFYRRYKKGVLISAGICLVIFGLVSYYTFQLSKQKDQAAIEANKATQITNLLTEILHQSSPMARYQPDITLRQVLDNGTKKIKNELKSQPIVKAELLGLLGKIYTDMGSYGNGKPLLESSLAIQDSLHSSDDLRRANTMTQLGRLLFRQGNYEESEKYYHNARKILRKLPNNTADLSSLENNLGMLYDEMGRRKDAITIYKHALKLKVKNRSDSDLEIMGNLAVVYQKQNLFDKAAGLFKEQIRQYKKGNTLTVPLASAYNNLAYTYQRAGQIAEADSLHQIALAMREKLLPPNHPHIASSLVRFGLLKIQEGQLPQAEKMLQRGYEILKSCLPENHWQRLSAKGALAFCRGLEGKQPNAIRQLRVISTNFSNRFGTSDWRTQEANKALQTLIMMSKKSISPQ